ncbi:MFS general substrate transporter [Suillus decipiens]|nr:MFS general substrate transporter [Suillus decipiens]
MQAAESALQPVKSKGDPSHTDQLDSSDFPEGGVTAWGTVLGAFLIQFCGPGYTSSFGVFQDFYTQTYLTNYTPSAIAWIGSVNAFLLMSVGLVSGRLVDRGAFYHLMKIGCLLQCFFLFMLSLAKPNQYYQVFLTHGVGFGIAIGLTCVPSIVVVSHYFQRRRAFAMGLVISGSAMGAVLYPIMLNNLINGRLGFANGLRVSTGMIGSLLLIACLLMRTRLPPKPQAVSYARVFHNSLRDHVYVCACFGMAAFRVGYYFVIFFLQLDSRLHGLSKEFSFYSLTTVNGGSFVGRFTAGIVASYLGIPNTIIGYSFISSALIFSMIGLHSAASVVLIGISCGYFSGGFIALAPSLISHLTPDISDVGARIGIMFALSSPPICGAVLTSHYIWWKPIFLAGGIATSGTILLLFMQFLLKIRPTIANVCSKETAV